MAILPTSRILALAMLIALVAFAAPAIGHSEHSAMAKPGGFSSPLLPKGASWSHTFNDAGEFAYHCHPHPDMQGTISVKADAPEGATLAVRIATFMFDPLDIQIRPGTNVTWTNEDANAHTVTESMMETPTTTPKGASPAAAAFAAIAVFVGLAAWVRRS